MNLPDTFKIMCTLRATINGVDQTQDIVQFFHRFRRGYKNAQGDYFKPEEIIVHVESGHWKMEKP